MSDEQKTKSPNPRDWPREWVQDPDFWRDVATRTIAGILALIFVFFVGLAGGYLKSPDNWIVFVSVALGLALLAFFPLFFYGISGHGKPPEELTTIDDAAAAIWAKRRARRNRQKSTRSRSRRSKTQ